jgi:hypothetical protein
MSQASRKSSRLAKKPDSQAAATDSDDLLHKDIAIDQTDLPEAPDSSETPSSLNSFPSSSVTPYSTLRDEFQYDAPPGPETLDERRKRIHLDCEHRRRRQISEGLFRLSQILPKELPRGSKMEILNSGILAIELYEQRLSNLQVQQLELSGMKQVDGDDLI